MQRGAPSWRNCWDELLARCDVLLIGSTKVEGKGLEWKSREFLGSLPSGPDYLMVNSDIRAVCPSRITTPRSGGGKWL